MKFKKGYENNIYSLKYLRNNGNKRRRSIQKNVCMGARLLSETNLKVTDSNKVVGPGYWWRRRKRGVSCHEYGYAGGGGGGGGESCGSGGGISCNYENPNEDDVSVVRGSELTSNLRSNSQMRGNSFENNNGDSLRKNRGNYKRSRQWRNEQETAGNESPTRAYHSDSETTAGSAAVRRREPTYRSQNNLVAGGGGSGTATAAIPTVMPSNVCNEGIVLPEAQDNNSSHYYCICYRRQVPPSVASDGAAAVPTAAVDGPLHLPPHASTPQLSPDTSIVRPNVLHSKRFSLRESSTTSLVLDGPFDFANLQIPATAAGNHNTSGGYHTVGDSTGSGSYGPNTPFPRSEVMMVERSPSLQNLSYCQPAGNSSNGGDNSGIGVSAGLHHQQLPHHLYNTAATTTSCSSFYTNTTNPSSRVSCSSDIPCEYPPPHNCNNNATTSKQHSQLPYSMESHYPNNFNHNCPPHFVSSTDFRNHTNYSTGGFSSSNINSNSSQLTNEDLSAYMDLMIHIPKMHL